MIAVIMCGGMGTRMRPITDLIPKPLLQVAGREILDILIEKLTVAGADTIYLTLGCKADMIREYIAEKDYQTQIITVTESVPLGTAGGVRNAIGETMDDVLVLSGDNIFGYDLKQAYQEHLNSNAHVSIIGTLQNDPRDYGTIQVTSDGTIESFIEKPSWAQVQSNIINTGIYFLKGDIISLIPANEKYDFANDLFPLLMNKKYVFRCLLPQGVWGDLGDIESYLDVNTKTLTGTYGDIVKNGTLYQENKILQNGTVITAPCMIGENVVFGDNCQIGPNAVICHSCTIGMDSKISNSVISENCTANVSLICRSSFVGQNSQIGACVKIENRTVLAGQLKIGNFVTLNNECKVLPGCSIRDNAYISNETVLQKNTVADMTANGVKGSAFQSLSLKDAVAVGAAVASSKSINRIGVADDGSVISEIFKNAVNIGLRSCGKTVYDFGTAFRSQRVFYSQYCNLDFFVHVMSSKDDIELSFSERAGSPVCRKTERDILSAYRYNLFSYAQASQCKDTFIMNPLSAVYKSIMQHRLVRSDKRFSVAVECDNRAIYELLHEILHVRGYECDYGGLLFMIDKNGEKFYAVENERAYSYDRILSICCYYEFLNGKNVTVSESAPGILEFLAQKHNCKVFRIYEGDCSAKDEALENLVASPWVLDGIHCIIRLLEIMYKTRKSLLQLDADLPECYVKNLMLDYNGAPERFNNSIQKNGAVRSADRLGYYEWEDERGTIRMKPDSSCRNIRVLIEAESIELSRELAAEAEDKLNNCAIDKF